jgi:HEAT repeat protein
VRRRACEHLARHPAAEHKQVLLKSLKDEPQVAHAALAALLKCPAELESPAPLEALLTSSDRTLRVEAAEGLAILGVPSGAAALERLARDPDPAIRHNAAAALGRTGDAAFVPLLIELLDDQGGVREAALASLAHIAGRDVARDGQAEPPTNSLEEVSRWRQWHQARR